MSADLLADLRALRDRTRDDRHAFTFPLFLFAGLILLAPLCYVTMHLPQEAFEHGVVGWYWTIAIVGGWWLTSWWYRQRARQSGVETDVWPAAAAAGAAFLGFLIWEPLFMTFLGHRLDLYPLYSLPAVNLPILVVSCALAAITFWWSLRPRRTGWPRTAGVFVATFLATTAFGAVGVYFIEGFAALMVIAAALLMLAWWERSKLFALFSVLAPAVTLLAGGVVAALKARR
jgi:hypothetical protein